MIDEDFCNILEWELSAAFKYSDLEAVKWFWCDGVIMSEGEICYTKKYINDNRQTTFRAFIGMDGQTHYKLILLFGPKALSRNARDLDITECIPDPETPDWFSIDTDKKIIEVQLY
ncbi:hypothetical protein A3860_13550 [Niastella vici]|uniref:Uncharacterized protein n=1 Tax=Niastella vici TaxID=1703345 RepID=A0A1V9G779_9BACT|nr:hypothetical protein [Niastella vici]OQP66505.1 hypothetical protein A3860_13550 [Niastella vici]